MQWRKFEQGNVPQNEPFLLWIEGDLFFAMCCGDRIITKSCYSDICAVKPDGVKKRGTYTKYFLENLYFYRNVIPSWCHLHKPENAK